MMDPEKLSLYLQEWIVNTRQLRLPNWDSLPSLELYMDQVIILLTQYLGPIARDEVGKTITASIINNYVRMKVMPPPIKKKYGRAHLACLMMICTLKQSLSIASIQKLLPTDHSEEAIHALYDSFVCQFGRVAEFLSSQVETHGQDLSSNSAVITSAVTATLTKDLTEYLLAINEEI